MLKIWGNKNTRKGNRAEPNVLLTKQIIFTSKAESSHRSSQILEDATRTKNGRLEKTILTASEKHRNSFRPGLKAFPGLRNA